MIISHTKIKQRIIESSKQAGFTLVELLIVVIILATLAAIIVPQFAGSTDDAKLAALDSNLAAVRSSISLYRQQHGEFPGNTITEDGTCAGTDGTAADALVASAAAGFKDQLTLYTKLTGEACSRPDVAGTPTFIYGPYLGADDLPINPYSNTRDLKVIEDGDLNLGGSVEVSEDTAWLYDRKSGKFIANDKTDDRHLR